MLVIPFSLLNVLRGEPVRTTVQNQPISTSFPVEGMLPWRQWAGSDDGFAAVCGLSLLQFAFTEGLDGAQQGGAASSRSVRGGQRRRSGKGVRHGRRRRRWRWRGRSGLASWMTGREKRDAVWEKKNKNAKTTQLCAASHETLCHNNPLLQLLRQIAQELLALQLAEAGWKPDSGGGLSGRPLEASLMAWIRLQFIFISLLPDNTTRTTLTNHCSQPCASL